MNEENFEFIEDKAQEHQIEVEHRKYRSSHKEGLRYPAINDLISHVHNKYELVIGTSKRAREIVEGAIPLVEVSNNENPISIVTEEIDEGKIKFTNPALDK